MHRPQKSVVVIRHSERGLFTSCGTPSANRELRVNLKGIDVSDLKVEKQHGT